MKQPDMSGISRTVGIDLGSKPKKTAVCQIEWRPDGGRILPAEDAKLTNKYLVKMISDSNVSHVGIDAPFGWPTEFVEAISKYQESTTWHSPEQRTLRFRKTDLHVKAVTGRDPLSVTAGYLVYLAWRCAEIMSKVPDWDRSSRRGDGRLIEVYPVGSMHQWGMDPKSWDDDPGSYKGKEPDRVRRRTTLVKRIQKEAQGRLDFDGQEQRFIDSDDELDALIASLMARAVSQDLAEPIPSELDEIVLKEGWIRLPKVDSTLEEACQ